MARRRWLTRIPLALAAVYVGVGVLWWRSADGQGLDAYDFYGQFYPLWLALWRALHEGTGLFWNPYQSCGQPLFAGLTFHVGPFYPSHWLYAVLDREPAVIVDAICNLALAGAGTFALCRSVGLGVTASLCGALAFQLSWSATTLASWSPSHFAPYACLPLVMWRTERLVRRPGVREAALLALAITLQIFGGLPEIVFFTYQLIGLRLVWAMLARQATPPALAGAAAIGLVLPFLLAAIHLLPALDVVRASLRSGSLTEQLGPSFSWPALGQFIATRFGPGQALGTVLALVAIASARRLHRWGAIGLYVLVVVAYVILAIGPGSWLFDLYSLLPFGNSFRDSTRLYWVVTWAMAVLVGFGAEALLAPGSADRRRRLAWVTAGVVATSAALLLGLVRLRVVDVVTLLPLLAVAFAPARLPYRRWLPAVLLLTIGVHYVVAAPPPMFGLRRGPVYSKNEDVFAFVRERMTPQDRVMIVGGHPELALMPKSATLFRVPGIHDYEGLGSRTYAEFFAYLRLGRPMAALDEWYWTFGKLLLPTLQRPLLDLTGARYLVVQKRYDRTATVLSPPPTLLLQNAQVRLYENAQALPRIRYVPRVLVKPRHEILPALAQGTDLRDVALVERLPASGFAGTATPATGAVQVRENAAERLVVRVTASAPGFLFVADQLFPGWTATVNGAEHEILSANYAFRLVEVPAGESDVVFTYRAPGVVAGLAISVVALVVLAALWRRGAVRP